MWLGGLQTQRGVNLFNVVTKGKVAGRLANATWRQLLYSGFHTPKAVAYHEPTVMVHTPKAVAYHEPTVM